MVQRALALLLAAAIVGSFGLFQPAETWAQGPPGPPTARGNFSVPVSGTVLQTGDPVNGRFDIQRFRINSADNTIEAVGVAVVSWIHPDNGPMTSAVQAAVRVDPSVVDPSTVVIQQQQQVCPILFLELGPLDLNLLGLVIQLDQVTLNIFAEPGPGQLLGNLLCALVGLLDPVQGPLQQIVNLLNQILAILSGL